MLFGLPPESAFTFAGIPNKVAFVWSPFHYPSQMVTFRAHRPANLNCYFELSGNVKDDPLATPDWNNNDIGKDLLYLS